MTSELSSSPFLTSDFTESNIPLDLRLLIDFECNNLLKGSPSSTSKFDLINSSAVTLFPKILIFSTYVFLDSLIKNLKSIVLSSLTVSNTSASINS